MKSIHHSDSGKNDCENHLFGHSILENQIQALSRTFRHRFKNFQKTHMCPDYYINYLEDLTSQRHYVASSLCIHN